MAENQTTIPYDKTVSTKRLQMLKTIVPYVEAPQKRRLVTLIQFMEYQTVMRALNDADNQLCACSVPDGSAKTATLLGELKQFCSQSEQDAIDNLLNIISIMDNYELFSN